MWKTDHFRFCSGGFINYVVMISIVTANADLLANGNGNSSWSKSMTEHTIKPNNISRAAVIDLYTLLRRSEHSVLQHQRHCMGAGRVLISSRTRVLHGTSRPRHWRSSRHRTSHFRLCESPFPPSSTTQIPKVYIHILIRKNSNTPSPPFKIVHPPSPQLRHARTQSSPTHPIRRLHPLQPIPNLRHSQPTPRGIFCAILSPQLSAEHL